jgi:hypothetical protein
MHGPNGSHHFGRSRVALALGAFYQKGDALPIEGAMVTLGESGKPRVCRLSDTRTCHPHALWLAGIRVTLR